MGLYGQKQPLAKTSTTEYQVRMQNKHRESTGGYLRGYRPNFALLWPVRKAFAVALLSGVIYGAAGGFGFPFLAYRIFPVLFGDTPPTPWVLVGAVLLLPATFTLRGLSGFANHYLSAYCGVQVLNALKLQLFTRLQQLPAVFFTKHRTGDLMQRVTNDTAAVQMVVTTATNDLIRQPVTLIGALSALIFMAIRSRELVFILLALAVVPICALPMRLIGKHLLRRAKQQQASAGNIGTVLHENFGAVREVRAFNLQQHEISRFQACLDRLATTTMKTVKYGQMLAPGIEIITACGVSLAVYHAARRQVSLATVLPLMSALYMCYEPLKKFGVIHNLIKRGQASIERIQAILAAEDAVPETLDPVAWGDPQPAIQFDQVEFAYQHEPVLRDLSFTLPAGSVTALVGSSGSGKTTIANLIPRFYDVQKGTIRIGGIDCRTFALADLRDHISIVSQETFLFNDTIHNNIRLGRLDATDNEVEQAARLAHAHDFIMACPEGYQTHVGERGLRLSGGQRQRIAIARAFLRQAPILILDEATSALDAESEAAVQLALQELIKGKTVLIIAHRFSTLRLAERILLLDEGRLRAEGNHTQLYTEDTRYRSLYDHQIIH